MAYLEEQTERIVHKQFNLLATLLINPIIINIGFEKNKLRKFKSYPKKKKLNSSIRLLFFILCIFLNIFILCSTPIRKKDGIFLFETKMEKRDARKNKSEKSPSHSMQTTAQRHFFLVKKSLSQKKDNQNFLTVRFKT